MLQRELLQMSRMVDIPAVQSKELRGESWSRLMSEELTVCFIQGGGDVDGEQQ